MRVKNTMRLVRVANNYINIYYDIEAEHVIDIKNANTDPCAMIIDGFKFGGEENSFCRECQSFER